MSIYGTRRSYEDCDNVRDHQEQARRDARSGRPDYGEYDRYGNGCQMAYSDEYDRERRNIREARDLREEEEAQELRHQERLHYERLAEAEQEEGAEYPPRMPMKYEESSELPF